MSDKPASIAYLKIFFLAFFLLIVVAIIFRLVSLFSGSSFTGNSFSILYVSKNSKIISVEKSSKSVVYVSVGNVRSIVKGKSPFVAGIALGVPINAMIYDTDTSRDPDYSDFISYGNEARMIFSVNKNFENMNEYDLHKVLSIARGADKYSVKNVSVNLFDEESVNKNLEGAFLDHQIRDADSTVEIVNSTEINGLANAVASILTKKGYNVIALQNAKGSYDDNSYVGYSFTENLFTQFLLQLTGFEKRNDTYSNTADVTIYLGADITTQFNN